MSYVLVVHRWTLRQARYATYSRAGHDLVFVTTRASARTIEGPTRSVVEVESLDEVAAVDAAINALVRAHGVPERVVALNEADLETAARWRVRLGVKGDRPEVITRFRDKLAMLDLVSAGGDLPVPRYARADTTTEATTAAAAIGYPVVFKPRQGTASRGVLLVTAAADWPAAAVTEPSIVQAWCDWAIGHVDGWWDGDRLVVARCSMYVNDCAAYLTGTGLGSYELPPGPRAAAMTRAADRVLSRMSPDRATVFHLELFVNESDDVQFLEIATRAGGAEIPFVWREVHGTDLLEVAWNIQLGLPTADQGRGFEETSALAGWVLSHGRVRPAPHVYWSEEEEPPRAAGVYEGARAKYRLRADEHGQLEPAIQRILTAMEERCDTAQL